MGLLGSLVYNIKANTAELEKGSKKAKKSFQSIDGAAKQASQGIKAGFGNLQQTLAPGIGASGQLFGVFKSGIGILKGSVAGVKSLKTALISSGIGAIVVALGAAFAGLSSWINRTTEGTDEANKIWAMISATFDAVIDKVSIIGSAIGKLLKGDFKGAADEARRFINESANIFTEIREEAAEAIELQKRENQLRKDKIAFIVREAELRNKISDYILKSRQLERSAEERLEAVNKAQELQKQLYGEKVRLAEEEFSIQKRRNELGDSNYDDLEKEANLQRTMLMLQKERNDQVRETTNRQITLNAELDRAAALRRKTNLPAELGPVGIKSTMEAPDMKGVVGPIDQTKTNVQKLAEAGEDLGKTFENSFAQMTGGAQDFGETVKGIAKSNIQGYIAEGIAGAVKNALAFIPPPFNLIAAGVAGAGAAALFNKLIPSFATGGIMPYDGMATVGERGPEKVFLPQGARVMSNIQSRQSGGKLTGAIKGDGRDLWVIIKEQERLNSNTY